MGRSRPACGTTPTIQPLPKKTPGPPAGQARPRKTFLVHPWPPARHQASPRMPPTPKALEMSDKLIDAQLAILGLLVIIGDIVADEIEPVVPRQIPEKFPERTEWSPS